MLASGSLSYLVRHQQALERRVLTEANILQLLKLGTQKGAYLDDGLASRYWTRWACRSMLQNLLGLEVVQRLPSVQQLLQQFIEKWLGRVEAIATKCTEQAISYAGGVEVLDVVLEEMKQSETFLPAIAPNLFSPRTLAALADLCTLAELPSGSVRKMP